MDSKFDIMIIKHSRQQTSDGSPFRHHTFEHLLFSQQTSEYSPLSQKTFADLSTNGAESAERRRKAQKTQRDAKGAERRNKVQAGTERRTQGAERRTNARIIDV